MNNQTQMEKALEKWHLFTTSKDPKYLDELLADDVVFYSPIEHAPQKGKWITTGYLMSAMMILGADKSKFTYVKEVMNTKDAILEFTAEIDGISINGVDMISVNEAGKLNVFKVMIRPLKAVNLIHEKMGEILKEMQT
jgi:hypothetical protein